MSLTESRGRRRLLLGSTSRYRAELLGRLGVPFDVAAPRVDERSLDHRLGELGEADFAIHLATEKAKSLADDWPSHFILAADQIAVLPGTPPRLLHKPGTETRAVDQLMELSGREHVLTTGVVLLDPVTAQQRSAVDRQHMHMRRFPRGTAEAYVRTHRPLDCAGAYRIEDAGIALFERAQGDDYTGIIGLPLIAVGRLLREVELLW